MGRKARAPVLGERIEKIWEALEVLLERNGERIEYLDATVFLVDPDTMEEVGSLLEEAADEGRRMELPEAWTESPFYDRLKRINPDSPAISHRFYSRKTPTILTDREKVREELGHYFQVWKNMKLKALREELESGGYTVEEADRLRQATEAEVREAEIAADELARNFDAYEVFITKYRHAREYPSVYLRLENGERRNEALRINGVANLLSVAREPGELRRKDAKIERLMQEYLSAGDWIFYRPIEEGTEREDG